MATERRYSEGTAREIDRALRRISDSAFRRAVDILTRNRATLEQGARQLLQKEMLSEAEVAELAASLVREPRLAVVAQRTIPFRRRAPSRSRADAAQRPLEAA